MAWCLCRDEDDFSQYFSQSSPFVKEGQSPVIGVTGQTFRGWVAFFDATDGSSAAIHRGRFLDAAH
jgi:hypothetical protein